MYTRKMSPLAFASLLLLLPLARANVYLAPAGSPRANYAPALNFPAVATAIEDHKCGCLFVASSPQNYAFCLEPHDNPFQWSSVSVNFNGEVYVTTAHDKGPLTLQLANMNETQVELIEHMFQHYSQDLVFPALSPSIQLVSAPAPPAQHPQRRMYLPPAPIARPYLHNLQPAGVYQPQARPLPVVPTNYFNLDHSPNNSSLLGDIYNFDLSGRILDVYSNSVSLHLGERSIIYRNPGFFSYARPGLPINIIRFFVAGDFLLFVYQDGSVLAKPVGLLDQVEAALVAEAKKEINELLHLWPHRRNRADRPDKDDGLPDEGDAAESAESEAD